MKAIELKYPVKTIVNDKEVEIKFLYPVNRLKLKHISLIPPSLANNFDGNEDKKKKVDSGEMMKMLPELKPFLASILNTTEDIIDEIDLDDLEKVLGALDSLMENEIEKKN